MAKEEKQKLTKEEKKEQKRLAKEEMKKWKEEKKLAKKEGRPIPPKPGKKQKPKNDGEEEEIGGTGLIIFASILIVLVWLAIVALLIKMDVGGFGSTVLYPYLKDVPVINRILPGIEEELEEKEEKDYAEEDEAYRFDSMEDAVDRIKELEKQLAKEKKKRNNKNARVAELESQVADLKQYKDNVVAFEKEKEKFYNEVVFSDVAPDINAYKEYYESIEPENAEKIYQKVIEQLQASAEIKEYADTYSNMKADQAAAIFNTMTDNLKLVAKILKAMSVQDRSKILAAMDQDTAAKLTEILEP